MFLSNRKRGSVLVAVVAVLGVAGAAVAQGPPVLPAIPEIIDYDSIGTVIAAAGAIILSVVFIYKVGFSLVKRIVKRVTSAI